MTTGVRPDVGMGQDAAYIAALDRAEANRDSDGVVKRMRRRLGMQPGSREPLDPRDPLAIARRLIADRYTRDNRRLVHAWRGDLRRFTGTHYAAVSTDEARSEAYLYLESSHRLGPNGKEALKPNAALVSNVLDALRGAAYLREEIESPSWLDGTDDPPARELIACANGVLHFPTRELLPHSPALFTTHALPFAFDEAVGEPCEWLRFLGSLWPNDPTSIAALQEMFGYVISGDRRQQKMFLLIGPKRAGKDTIAKVLRRLIGEEHCAGPTLSSLSGQFGLEPLIDKPLAVIADARLSGRADQAVIAERLLTITGEGFQSVDRKHRDAWHGQLPTRFLILTNELPRLEDASGALASRFVLLRLTETFYGREDLSLFSRIERELPAIFRWALDGLDRLGIGQRFTESTSSRDALRELEDLSSPVQAFVRQRCMLDSDSWVECGELHAEFARWSERYGRRHVPPPNQFSRDLHSAFPDIVTRQKGSGMHKVRAHVGIRLRSALDGEDSAE